MLSLGATSLVPSLHEVDESFPLPQANDLDKIASVADAVAAGAVTNQALATAIGVSDREGAYYAAAAGYLGLVTRRTQDGTSVYEPTPLGEVFADGDDEARSEAMIDLVARVPAVQAWHDGGGVAVEDRIRQSGYAEATVARRAATIRSWIGQCGDVAGLRERSRATRVGTSERVGAAAAQARTFLELRRRIVAGEVTCPDCHVTIPATGVCGWCDRVVAAA